MAAVGAGEGLVVAAVSAVAASVVLVVEAPAAAAQAAVGSLAPAFCVRTEGRLIQLLAIAEQTERHGMVPEKLINEFVERMRAAAGTNLLAAILYGSAVAGDYVADYSDVNLLFALRETSYAAIETVVPAIEWWKKQKHRLPLLMSAEEMRRSADVFSIEFLDMRRHYRVLWGEDILKMLEVPMRLHRAQVEYELREKTLLLRQGLLAVAGNNRNDDAKWDLLLRSLSAFGTLFRHALIALGDPASGTKREAANILADKTGIDTSVYGQLVDIRERRKDRKSVKVDDMFARYLKLLEQVTSAVDKMLDPTV